MNWGNKRAPNCPACGAKQERATFSPPIGLVVRTCTNGHTWRTLPSTREQKQCLRD